MNTAEANYLTNSFEGLSRTLLQNRMMKQQEAEQIRRNLLEREMMNQRGALAGQELNQRKEQFGQNLGLQRDELSQRKSQFEQGFQQREKEFTTSMQDRQAERDQRTTERAQDQDAAYTDRAEAREEQTKWHENQQLVATARTLGDQYRADQSAVTTPEEAKAMAAKWKNVWKQMNDGTRATFGMAGIDPENPVFTVPQAKEPRSSRETINLDAVDQMLQKANELDIKGDKGGAARLRERAANLEKATFNTSTTTETIDVMNVPQVAQSAYTSLIEEKGKHTTQLAQGDQHYGVTQIVPRTSTSRTNRMAEIDRSLAALEKSYPELRKLRPKEAGEAGPPAAGPAAPPMDLAPAGSNDVVRVISPDGKTGTIPRAQLEAAIRKGFKPAQ